MIVLPRSAFSRRLIWLAVLGYGYLAVLIGVLVLAIVLMVVGTPRLVQLVWIPAGLLLLVLSALRVRFEPADGIRLTRLDAPRLYDVTGEIARPVAVRSRGMSQGFRGCAQMARSHILVGRYR
jgi:hypothetical protein